ADPHRRRATRIKVHAHDDDTSSCFSSHWQPSTGPHVGHTLTVPATQWHGTFQLPTSHPHCSPSCQRRTVRWHAEHTRCGFAGVTEGGGRALTVSAGSSDRRACRSSTGAVPNRSSAGLLTRTI